MHLPVDVPAYLYFVPDRDRDRVSVIKLFYIEYPRDNGCNIKAPL